jgi:hypothetical protein
MSTRARSGSTNKRRKPPFADVRVHAVDPILSACLFVGYILELVMHTVQYVKYDGYSQREISHFSANASSKHAIARRLFHAKPWQWGPDLEYLAEQIAGPRLVPEDLYG